MLLVTGITGHSGRYFIDELVKNNYKGKIRCIVRNTSNIGYLKNSGLNYELVMGDLKDTEFLESVFKDVDVLLHIAGIFFSENLVKVAIKNNVKRAILVHTTGIYSKYKMASAEYKKIEANVINISKDKIDITILRPTMIYGNLCDYNISKFIKMVDKMKIYPMIAGGKAKIQPVNARDLAQAYYKVLINPEITKNKSYNLSGKKAISIKDMMILIGKYLNKKTIFIYTPMWFSLFVAYVLKIFSFGKFNIVEKVLRMDEDRVFSYDDAVNDFGYDPIPFEKGLQLEVEQYIDKNYSNKDISKSNVKKVLFTATVDSHIMHFHIPHLKYFKDNGYEVHVATNGEQEIPYCDVKHKISFERKPFKINNIKAIGQLKKIIDQEHFDIIHCHTPMGGVVTRLAAKDARKHGTKVFYTAHGFHFYKGAPPLNWMLYYPIEKYLSRYTDVLITINDEDYNLAKTKFHAKETYLVHGVGVDPKKFDFEFTEEQKDKLRDEIGIEKSDYVIIYVAELSKRKHQDMLIEVFSNLCKKQNNVKLLLVGNDSMNGYYQQLARDCDITNDVKFLGYRKDAPKLLKISNLLVSTSRQEGLPVNIMEGMAYGIPIACTNCRGNRDLVENNVDGFLVDIDDTYSMQKYIEVLMNNEDICNLFIQNSKEKIEKYKLNNVMKEMKEVYNIE